MEIIELGAFYNFIPQDNFITLVTHEHNVEKINFRQSDRTTIIQKQQITAIMNPVNSAWDYLSKKINNILKSGLKLTES